MQLCQMDAGAPEEIRTPDPQIRSLVLYPAELRARFHDSSGLERPVHPVKARRTSRKSALATGFRSALQGPDRGKGHAFSPGETRKTPENSSERASAYALFRSLRTLSGSTGRSAISLLQVALLLPPSR